MNNTNGGVVFRYNQIVGVCGFGPGDQRAGGVCAGVTVHPREGDVHDTAGPVCPVANFLSGEIWKMKLRIQWKGQAGVYKKMS